MDSSFPYMVTFTPYMEIYGTVFSVCFLVVGPGIIWVVLRKYIEFIPEFRLPKLFKFRLRSQSGNPISMDKFQTKSAFSQILFTFSYYYLHKNSDNRCLKNMLNNLSVSFYKLYSFTLFFYGNNLT